MSYRKHLMTSDEPPSELYKAAEVGTNLASLGTDCISRQSAVDALRTCYDTETITMDNGDEYINYGDAVGEIEQLPPIQPKRGKWILDRSGAYCCSECMEPCAGYVMKVDAIDPKTQVISTMAVEESRFAMNG